MIFKDVIDALVEGKMVRRKSWDEDRFITKINYSHLYENNYFSLDEVFCDDWEIVTESGKTFHDVLEHLLKGGKIKIKVWRNSPGIWFKEEELNATDWEEL
jgi:hypothetical protein